jgi:hypothetical protein
MIRASLLTIALLAHGAVACDTEEELALDRLTTANHDGQGGVFRSFNDPSTGCVLQDKTV